jgi:hypothetical protein
VARVAEKQSRQRVAMFFLSYKPTLAGCRQLLRAMQIDWEVVNMAISLYLCRSEANR